ncbi:MAG: hypothetical protein QM817_06180 [Archangium sp.]
MSTDNAAVPRPPSWFSLSLLITWVIIPINFGVYSIMFTDSSGDEKNGLFVAFAVLCVVQLITGIVTVISGGRAWSKAREEKVSGAGATFRVVLGALGGIGGPVGGMLGLFGIALSGLGGAWGRPLRVKGRQLHPELREGADWTCGEKPDASRLDQPTRNALEALWLHDAQKEHASVPAFSRISWLLAAVGAPAELMLWSNRAAMEEIDHAQRCFALAAGYGGRSFTVEPMPDLLLGGLGDVKDPLVTLAVESLKDGCLLEDFNADVAAKCAAVCEEPVTHAVLEQIAREERSHADFSWALIDWLVEQHGARVTQPLLRACDELEQVQRPTSADAQKQKLVELADQLALRRHGRLRDAEWATCWQARLTATRERLNARLSTRRAA